MTVDITPFTSFQTPAHAKQLILLNSLSQLDSFSQQCFNSRPIILGSGSNVLFVDDSDKTVIVNRLLKREIIHDHDDFVEIVLGAGENWHDVVCSMTHDGYYGLENLALIPGTMGAAPIQNIGAYGVEISQFIKNVQAFDLLENRFCSFSKADCQFAYRDSIFKYEENTGRYIITDVTLRLNKVFQPVLSYKGLEFPDTESLTAQKLLDAVIAVRQSKIPDPAVLPNAGSFFKNPIVTCEHLQTLKKTYENIPFYKVDEHYVKIPAAWLLETAGFKGKMTESGAGVYENHALILINKGNAHGSDIYALAVSMMQKVQDMFAIAISPEVRIIGA